MLKKWKSNKIFEAIKNTSLNPREFKLKDAACNKNQLS